MAIKIEFIVFKFVCVRCCFQFCSHVFVLLLHYRSHSVLGCMLLSDVFFLLSSSCCLVWSAKAYTHSFSFSNPIWSFRSAKADSFRKIEMRFRNKRLELDPQKFDWHGTHLIQRKNSEEFQHFLDFYLQ